MKTFTSIALAGVLAASTFSATATGASAGGWGGPGEWHRHAGPHPHSTYSTTYSAPDAGGALVAGAILGLTFGLIANQALAEPDPYSPPRYFRQPDQAFGEADPYSASPYTDEQYASADEAHVDWCRATYSSYDDASDTWVDFQGVVRRCIEPN